MKIKLLSIFALLTLFVGSLTAQNCSVEITKQKVDHALALSLEFGQVNDAEIRSVKWSTGETNTRILIQANGEYCVRVVFTSGCTSDNCIVIDDFNSQDCRVGISRTVDEDGNIILCAEPSPAGLHVDYHWSNGVIGQCIRAEESGEYCVEVVFGNGCVVRECIKVEIDRDCSVDIIRSLEADGSTILCIDPSPSGQHMNIRWSTGSDDKCIGLEEGGEYCVEITFADGCVATKCVRVELEEECRVEITRTVDENGNILLCADTASPTNEHILIIWSTGEEGACIRANHSGEYCVEVIYANGCIASQCVRVEIEDDCRVSIERRVDENGNVTLCANTDPTVSEVEFRWSNGSNDRCIKLGDELDYCVEAIFSNGCIATDCIHLGEEFCRVEIIRSIDDEGNVTLCADAGPTDDIKIYRWNTGSDGNCIRAKESGEYCVEVIFGNGCIARACIVVELDVECKVEIVRSFDDNGDIVLCAVTKSVDADVKFRWSNGEDGECIRIEESGEYCVEVIFENGCIARDCIYVPIDDDSCRVEIVRQITLDGSIILCADPISDVPEYYYGWTTGSNDPCISIIENGLYCVSLTYPNGCTATTCVTITSFPNTNDCHFRIEESEVAAGTILTMISRPDLPFEYIEWTTGETTRSILVNDGGEYCAKVILSNGCEGSACFVVQGLDDGLFPSESDTEVPINIPVLNENEDGAILSPNPFYNELKIDLSKLLKGKYTVEVFKSDGALMLSKKIDLDKGQKALNFDFRDNQKGLYFVRITGENQMFTKKVIKY